MSIEKDLHTRAGSICELCNSTENLGVFTVPPSSDGDIDKSILICENCTTQIEDPEKVDANHWRCLNESMWSEVPAVQVVAWRMLNRLKSEGWPVDLLEMLYLDEKTIAWAESEEEKVVHLDSNGVVLQAGDSVILTQSLNVKGTSFIAKRGTAVRNISLIHDNAEHIEGKVNGQKIIILTKFVKKS